MQNLKKILSTRLNQYLFFLGLVFIFYGNTLSNGFVYDDPTFITNNNLIHNFSNIPKVFGGCLMGYSADSCQSAGVYYHPFLFLQFLLTYQISPQPFLFHLVNLLILSATLFLILIFFESILGKGMSALFATLLVLVNPINSEIGNFVSAVNDQYLVIFFILTFISFLKFSKTGKNKYLIFSLIFFFLDLVSKETAILLFIPIIFFIYFKPQKFKNKYKWYKFTLLFSIPILLYIGLRMIVLGRLIHNLTGYHDLGLLSQILTSISIYPIYLLKLIYPLSLNAQHDPPIVKVFDWRFYSALLFIAGNIAIIYFCFKKKLKNILFGFSIIFLSLLPILILINKIGRFILAERYLFLSSVGFSLIVIELAVKLKKSQKFLIIILVVYVGMSWWIVFNRNKDWHDEFTFNKSIAELTHNNFGVLFNLGVNYTNMNQYELAADSYKKSLEIKPDFWQSHNNLANAYLNLGLVDKAKEEYMIVQKLNPELITVSTSLDNLNLIESGTKSSTLKLNKNLLEYSKDDLSFNFPLFFYLQDQKEQKVISTADNSFSIQITQDTKGSLGIDDYLKTQKTRGTLVNQGLAQIPGFEKAYVKVWGKDGKTSLQFFLFKNTKVLVISVTPADSPFMKQFDLLLQTIHI